MTTTQTQTTSDEWYVIRTSIRGEDRAAKSLRQAGYRVYVPKMRKSIFQRRKKIWVTRHFGLMVRYIFVRMTRLSRDGRPDWYTLADCDGVESVLGIKGQPTAIPRDVVASFVRLQREHRFDEIRHVVVTNRQRRELAQARFRRNEAIRVLEGPFSGFAGHVTDVTARGAIRTMIEIFGRLTPVEFDAEQLENIDRTTEAA
jgi:transcription antitermination factor NusG